MREEPQEIDLTEYRRLTAGRKARNRRPAIPRAPQDERTGLTALLVKGWCTQSPDCVQYRLYIPGGPDTGLCASLKAACGKAKEFSL